MSTLACNREAMLLSLRSFDLWSVATPPSADWHPTQLKSVASTQEVFGYAIGFRGPAPDYEVIV